MEEKNYFVYIIANVTGKVLYVGMTNNLQRRMVEHRSGSIAGFAQKYRCIRLLHYEVGQDAYSIIEREKEIKSWRREKKEILIQVYNPERKDLFETLW